MSAQIVLTNRDLFNKIAVEKTKLKSPKFKENIKIHRQNNLEELKLYFKIFNENRVEEDSEEWFGGVGQTLVRSYWIWICETMEFPGHPPYDTDEQRMRHKLLNIAENNTGKNGYRFSLSVW